MAADSVDAREVVEDRTDDVVVEEVVEVRADGMEDIDIVSLTSREEGGRIVISLTVKGNISLSGAYSYSIHLGDVGAEIFNGEIDIDDDLVDSGAHVSAAGPSMFLYIDKDRFNEGAVQVSAEASYIDLKHPTDLTGSELYHDDLESVDPFDFMEIDLSDPAGDVSRIGTNTREVSTHPHLDIAYLALEKDGDGNYHLTMKVSGNIVKDDLNVSYEINLGNAWMYYSGGIGDICYSIGVATLYPDIEITGDTITAVFYGDYILNLNDIYAKTWEKDPVTGKTYQDFISMDTDIDTEGELGMSVHISLPSDGPAVMRIETTLSGGMARSLRAEMDLNLDGLINATEVASRMDLDLLEYERLSGIDPILRIDGMETMKEESISAKGVKGPARSGDSLVFIRELFSGVAIERGENHIISLILEKVERKASTNGTSFSLDITIESLNGWVVDPLSIEPRSMIHNMNPEGDTITIRVSSGVLADEGNSGISLIRFEISEKETDRTEREYPTTYWVGISLFLIIILTSWMYRRRRKT
ncbi:MAG: hypothetical protein ACMUHB_01445 [Thermoplasmatota archaeon]